MSNRREEVDLIDLNLFDPDASSDMFYGKFVHSFKNPNGGPDVSFVYRRIDPGTLLELIDQALLVAVDDEGGVSAYVEETTISQLKMNRVRIYHRMEVLQKCITLPKFKNLDQIKNLPMDWQIVLYNLIMHGTLGGDTATVTRFPEENQGSETQELLHKSA